MTAPVSAPSVVLASGSQTRLTLLTNAGLSPEVARPAVDEAAVKEALRAENATAAAVAEALAELKAVRVSRRRPGALVIGADQMLECEDAWFDKPQTREQARAQLMTLRGRTHRLISSAVVARDGERIWHQATEARLTMRSFSEAFLDQYLERVGEAVTASVGGYQLEGEGVQLFSRVQGDWFTILGLPLLPLLNFLREWSVVPE